MALGLKFIVAGVWAAPSSAHAEDCLIQNASAPGLWKSVRATDPANGNIVMQRVINGGDSKPLTVSGSSVRVEHKLAGDIHYHSAIVVACKGGNTIKV